MSLHQTGYVRYYSDSVFLLATDGLADVFRGMGFPEKSAVPAEIMDLLSIHCVSDIPDLLLALYDKPLHVCDDLGLIILDPNCFSGKFPIDVLM